MGQVLYLSRLILNPRSKQVRMEIALPYQLHRTLLQAFPQGKVKTERKNNEAVGVLFRLEESERESVIQILVQSKIAPDWGFVEDLKDGHGQPYLIPAEFLPGNRTNLMVKPFELRLSAGQILSFRLRANPTKRLGKNAGDDKGKRIGIYTEEGQTNWLTRKAKIGGFHVLQVQVRNDGKLKDVILRKDKDDQKLELLSVQFDGLLEVLDPEKFVETVANGIGSGKGFGFGLLSLAPVG